MIERLKLIGAVIVNPSQEITQWMRSAQEKPFALRISLSPTSESVKTPYFDHTVGEGSTNAVVEKEIREAEILRNNFYRMLGLDTTEAYYLAQSDLDADVPSENKFLHAIYVAQQAELAKKGKPYEELTGAERIEVDELSLETALKTICKREARDLIEGDVDRELGETSTAAEKRKAEEHADSLEKGEKKEDKNALAAVRIEKEKAEIRLRRAEEIIGISEAGETIEGLLQGAKEELETANNNKVRTENVQQSLETVNRNDPRYQRQVISEGIAQRKYNVLVTRQAQLAETNERLEADISSLISQIGQTQNQAQKAQLETRKVDKGNQIGKNTSESRSNSSTITSLSGQLKQYQDYLGPKEKELGDVSKEVAKAINDKEAAVRKLTGLMTELGLVISDVDDEGKIMAELARRRHETVTANEGFEEEQKKTVGDPEKKDLEKAKLIRAGLKLSESDTFNARIGAVNTDTARQMSQQDLSSAHVAQVEVVFDNIKFGAKKMQEDGKVVDVEEAHLTDEEKLQMLNRGEIVQAVMETFGIQPKDVLTKPKSKEYQKNMEKIRTLRADIINDLLTKRPMGYEVMLSATRENIERILFENQSILDGGFEKILPYLESRAIAQEFTRHAISYLRRKVATGEPVGVSYQMELLDIPKSAAEDYIIEGRFATDFGESEFQEGKPIYSAERGERPHNTVTYSGKDANGLKFESAIEFGKKRDRMTWRVRATDALWKKLPPTVSGAARIPLALQGVFYDNTGNRRPKEEVVNDRMIDLLERQSPDLDTILSGLKSFSPDGDQRLAASITRMIENMEPARISEILGEFKARTIRIDNINYIFSLEDDNLIVRGRDIPAEGQQFSSFMSDQDKKISVSLLPLQPDQISTAKKKAQKRTLHIYQTVGKELLLAMERKARGG